MSKKIGDRIGRVVSVFLSVILVVSVLGVGFSGDRHNFVRAVEPTSEGEYVDHIRIETRMEQSIGIGDTATGFLDAYLQVVDGPIYEGISDEWKAQLNVLESYISYNNLFFNPAWTEESRVEVDIVGDGNPEDFRFNPFAIQDVRYATNWIIDRQYIVEEIYDGYALPQYESIGPVYPTYEEHICPIEDEHGLRPPMPPDDFEYGYEMIQDAMEDAMFNPDLAGDVRAPADSPTSFWQYRPPGGDWMDVETKGLIRIEDERFEIGHMFADLLEECHIKVDRIDGDRSLIDIWLFTDPADMEWSWYTGGGVRRDFTAYPHGLPVQHYTDYFGSMPGSEWPYTRYCYVRDEPYAQPLIDEYAEPLMSGKLPDEETYWEYVRHITDVGMSRSVRVFLTSPMDVVLLNRDSVAEVASEKFNGWSNLFSPRTVKTVDGTFTAGVYRSFFCEHFNTIGGDGDRLMQMQQYMSQDYATHSHSYKGTTIPMRANFIATEDIAERYDEFEVGDIMVRSDYEFDEDGNLIANLPLPDEGIYYYDVMSETWLEGGYEYAPEELNERDTVATAVTYQYNLGKWHSGHDFTLRDILAWHAFSKQLSFNEHWGAVGEQYYHFNWGHRNRPYHLNIVALEVDEENGLITYYGDHTFPIDDLIAGYYAEIPEVPWQLFEAVSHLRAQTELADGPTHWWSSGVAERVVHWLSNEQTGYFSNTLSNMADAGWIPPYLQGGPTPITEAELEDEIAAIRAFQEEYGHSWLTQGPFVLTNFDTANQIVEMDRWSEEDGYPFPPDHWKEVLTVKELRHGMMEAPTEITAGDELTTDVRVRVLEEYPKIRVRNLNVDKDDHVSTLTVYDDHGNEVYFTDDPEVINTDGSYFEVTIPGNETLYWEEGLYELEFESRLVDQENPVVSTINVWINEYEWELEGYELDVEPTGGFAPLDVEITVGAYNPGDASDSDDVVVDGEVIGTLTVPAGESAEETFTHTFTIAGVYTVHFGPESEEVMVEPREIPEGLINYELDVGPTSGDAPLDVTIEVSVENIGEEDTGDHVYILGSQEYTVEVPAGETVTENFTHTFDTAKTYLVSWGEHDEVVTVTEELDEDGLVNHTLSVDPTSGFAPLDVDISVSVENIDNVDGAVDVLIDGTVVYTLEVPAQDGARHEFVHTFDGAGEYEIEFGTQRQEVEVREKAVSIDGTTAVLLFGIIMVIVLTVVLLVIFLKMYDPDR